MKQNNSLVLMIKLQNGQEIQFPKREVECITYSFFGFKHTTIAERLEISVRTVEFYLRNAKARLGSQNTLNFKHEILASNFLEILFQRFHANS